MWKMVMNNFGKRNFRQPRLIMHSWTIPIEGGRGFFVFSLVPICSHHVSMGFPSSSQIVPKYIPQYVPNNTLVLFDMVCPEFNSHDINWNGAPKGSMTKHTFGERWREGSKFRLQCWGVPNVPKILVMGQWNGSIFKKERIVCIPLH
jgi:hypothetical protein